MTIRVNALRGLFGVLLGAMVIAVIAAVVIAMPVPVEEDPLVIALAVRVEKSATWTRKEAWGEYEHFTEIGLDGPKMFLAIEETWASERSHNSTETQISFDARDIAAVRVGVMAGVTAGVSGTDTPGKPAPALILRCRGGIPCISEDFTHHQYPSASGKTRHAVVHLRLAPTGQDGAAGDAAATALGQLFKLITR